MRRSSRVLAVAAAVVLGGAAAVAAGWIPTPLTGDPVALSPLPSAQVSRCAPRQSHGDLLPDPGCTPGAVNPAVAADGPRYLHTICLPGWADQQRKKLSGSRGTALKSQLLRDYGEYAGVGPSLYELDHLVSIELGGDVTSPFNLWVEWPPSHNPKDTVEDRAKAAVCAGRMTLAHAQEQMEKDWTVLAGEVAPASGG